MVVATSTGYCHDLRADETQACLCKWEEAKGVKVVSDWYSKCFGHRQDDSDASVRKETRRRVNRVRGVFSLLNEVGGVKGWSARTNVKNVGNAPSIGVVV